MELKSWDLEGIPENGNIDPVAINSTMVVLSKIDKDRNYYSIEMFRQSI
jgi:hypothetical protein